MIIEHPLLGPRDAEEFVHLGDASLLVRPDWQAGDATQVQKNSMTMFICAIIRRGNIASFGITSMGIGRI